MKCSHISDVLTNEIFGKYVQGDQAREKTLDAARVTKEES
jgi:hypothetical protein